MESVDVAILGSGASGLTAALAAHGHGASVAVYEKGSSWAAPAPGPAA